MALALCVSAVAGAFAATNGADEAKKENAGVVGMRPEELCKGKTVVFLGDSYVKNHRRPAEESWHSKAAAELGMNYVNWGRNGSSIAFDRTKDGFGPAMTERYKEMPAEADVVVVIAGHNDADYLRNHGMELWDDFCGGLDALLAGLKAKYPNAAIGFVTPWAVGRGCFPEVTDQIRKACREHSVALLDASACGVIDVNNADFRSRYFQGPEDTAHLNAAGHDLFLPLGRGFLASLVGSNQGAAK